jgi:hypothetical protein
MDYIYVYITVPQNSNVFQGCCEATFQKERLTQDSCPYSHEDPAAASVLEDSSLGLGDFMGCLKMYPLVI